MNKLLFALVAVLGLVMTSSVMAQAFSLHVGDNGVSISTGPVVVAPAPVVVAPPPPVVVVPPPVVVRPAPAPVVRHAPMVRPGPRVVVVP